MNFGDDRIHRVFWRHVSLAPITGCWMWTAYTNGNGYGVHGKRAPHSGSALTHRYTYEIEFGPLPNGAELDHCVCQTRACCNPHHVEPVAHAVNVRRGKAKKSRCKRGHELAGCNLMITRVGTRCRACYEMHALDRRAKLKSQYVPKPRKPQRLSPTCMRGHVMVHNGSRRVCHECRRLQAKARQLRIATSVPTMGAAPR
jgi:hypothetical protein